MGGRFMVKKMNEKNTLLIVLLCIVFCLCGCNSEAKKDDKIQYVNDSLGVQLNEWVASSEGEIAKQEDEGNTVLCFQLKEDSKDKVIECLNQAKITVLDKTTKVIPGYSKHEFAKRLESQETYAVYELMTSGEEAKTRTIRIFLAGDSKNTYLYFFG
jgi:hypothetical protein